jgi:cytosine/adenosine deaminase-related metal-dependent hydrolase
MHRRVPPNASMPAWAASLLALRQTDTPAPEAIAAAIRDARRSGTCLVGDVTNTLATFDPLVGSALSAVLFRELIGFAVADPAAAISEAAGQLAALAPAEKVRTALAPHAPYSVSPSLLKAISHWNRGRPLSIHLGESAQEIQFLADGTGEWRALLESLGVWNPSWTPPRCGPVEYLDRLGMVGKNLLAVHGVHFSDGDLTRLAAAGATIVACPRSNKWTGAGDPPVHRFFNSGVRVAVGTDSLASVADLNIFAELAVLRWLAPEVPATSLLRAATMSGAEALGFASELGSIEAGKRAQLLAVRVPPDVQDVEEYMVSGIDPADIRWLH